MSSQPDAPLPPRSEALRRAFVAACRAELEAPKPGNVHVHGEGHGMTVEDFLKSAEAAAAPLCRPRCPVGRRIRDAVAASWAAVPRNTNLGIVLLAAPLIAAAESGTGPLRARVTRVLEALTVPDAVDCFAAIAEANPAGLGRVAAQDVAAPPTDTLRAAMILAAERDRVARQYATGYEDVFAIGVARIAASRRSGHPQVPRHGPWTTTLVYLDFLTAFPDSHIARKYGSETAERVRRDSAALAQRLPSDPAATLPLLLEFDRHLKTSGLNPGTSADLTVAALLADAVAELRD
jgi:triphosphoribosyl-dephospho-CoA synthase